MFSSNDWDDFKTNFGSNNSSNAKKVDFSKFKKQNSGGGFNFDNNFEITPKKLGIGVLALFVFWILTGFYRNEPGQKSVELIFGKNVNVTSPGLNYNLPSPIGSIVKIDVEKIRRTDIGYRSTYNRGSFGKPSVESGLVDVINESLILTSDENIVDADFTVFWRVSNPEKFILKIKEPEEALKIAAESAMREVIGKTKFDDAVTTGRESIESETKEVLQLMLDDYSTGIIIEQVELQKSDPPAQVIEAFNDVQRARQDRDRLKNQAESYANSIVPIARGKAEQLIREAEGYKQKVILEAEGEALRFKKIYQEYRKSPKVVKERMYMDVMSKIYKEHDKIIIDKNAGNGVLPYLKLPDVNKK